MVEKKFDRIVELFNKERVTVYYDSLPKNYTLDYWGILL